MMRLSFGVAFLVAVGGCVLPPLDGALVRCEADTDCPTPQVCVVGVEGDRLCRAPGDPCVAVVDGVSRQQPDGTACAGGICVENACVAPRCGDGVTTAPEACDDGAANSDSAANACRSDCQPAECGDGTIDDGETCDDGAANSDADADACRTTCEPAACGDGVIDATEVCDDGAANSDVRANACRTTCVPASCGDGVRDLDEACDDGELNSDVVPGACRTSCERAACGDAIIDDGESCDDGDDNSDVAADACRTSCAPASCGDGVIDAGERCDDGDTNSDTRADACRTTCVPARCGDSIRDATEECDEGDGNDNDAADTCRVDCRRARCGDGAIDTGEVCDDGNVLSGDGCRGDCRKEERCGDGQLDQGEACDDANQNPRDGCDACRRMTWSVEVVARGRTLGDDLALTGPMGVAVDITGAVYIADTGGNRILRRDSNGTTVFAGTGSAGFSGDGGPAIAAELRGPTDIVVAANGDVYVADRLNDRIRRVTAADGVIRTIVGGGTGGASDGDGGPGALARLRRPRGVAIVDSRLLIAEEDGGRIRQTGLNGGNVATVVGTGDTDRPFLEDGIDLTVGRLQTPVDVVGVGDGRFVIAESGRRVLRLVDLATPTITTIAGGGQVPPSGTDPVDARTVALALPTSMVGEVGRVFVADAGARRIFSVELAATPLLRPVVGSGAPGPLADGANPLDVNLGRPIGLAGVSGRLSFADEAHHVIREVSAAGVVTIVGTGEPGVDTEGALATTVTLVEPIAVAPAASGGVYIADRGARRIYHRSAVGHLRTVVGTGDFGAPIDGEPATEAPIVPSSIATRSDGTLIASSIQGKNGGEIYEIGDDGIVSIIAVLGDLGASERGLDVETLPIAVDGLDRVVCAGVGFIGVQAPGETLISLPLALEGVPAAIAALAPGRIAIAGQGFLWYVDFDVVAGTTAITDVGIGKFVGTAGLLATGGSPDELFLSTSNGIDRIDSKGVVTPFIAVQDARAGDGVFIDETSVVAPAGLAFDDEGLLLVADAGAGLVRRMDQLGGQLVDTIAGDLHPAGPGPLPGAALYGPTTLVTLDDGSLLVGGSAGRLLQVLPEGAQRVDVVFGHPFPPVKPGPILARFAPLLEGVVLAPDQANGRVQLLDRGVRRQIDVTLPPRDWVVENVAVGATGGLTAGLVLPSGDVAVSSREDCVQFHPFRGATPALFGICGFAGSFDGLVRDPGGLALSPVSGAIYLADTGNHRVLRRASEQDETIDVVIGDGSSSSAGQGSPAREFPLQGPAHVAVDRFGNLFVSSTTTVRMVANVDGDADADGDDQVITIFGAGARTGFPESESRCLGALALDDDGDHVYVADACSGFLVRLTATTTP